jgi:histone H1/5
LFFHSRQAIKKHLLANHPSVTNVSENAFTTQLNKALQRGTDSGVFLRPKGKSNFQ